MSEIEDQPTPTESPPAATGSLESISRTVAKLVAIVTAIVSAAVPITELVRGYTSERLKETEARSQLAQQYLARLTAPDLKIDDRLMLLSALAQLKDHPLQPWAEEQQKQQTLELNELKKLGTKLQQSADMELSGQSGLSQLEAEIEVTKMKLSLANNIPDLERYRDALSTLNQKRNGLRAGADLAKQLNTYERSIIDLKSPPYSEDVTSKLKEISAAARKIAAEAFDTRVRISALRLAAVSAWDTNDFASAGEIQNDAQAICDGLTSGTFGIDRDCTLILFSEVLSAHRKFYQSQYDTFYATLLLRSARLHSDLLSPLPPGKRSRGTESALLHVTNALYMVACQSPPNSSGGPNDLLEVHAEFLKLIKFPVGDGNQTKRTCAALAPPNTIWP